MAFLEDILPTTGSYYAVGITPSGDALHKPCGTREELESSCLAFSQRGCNSYFAQASFKPGSARRQANVLAVRSLWLDIDVGKSGPSYPTREAALEAIHRFPIPPTYVVSSGFGFYMHFCLSEAVAPDRWKFLARWLDTFCKGGAIVADPACTTDVARILRLPGTVHVKSKGTVSVIEGPGDTYTDREFEDALAALAPDLRPAPTASPTASGAPNVFAQPPVYRAEPIVRGCPALMASGIGPEPAWYAMMSVMRRCVDGRDWAHRISMTDPKRYTQYDTDRKFDHAPEDAPALCSRFEGIDSRWCGECRFRGMVKSPVEIYRLSGSTPAATNLPEPDAVGKRESEEATPCSVSPGEELKRLVLPEEFAHSLIGLDTSRFTVSDSGIIQHTAEKAADGSLVKVDHIISASRLYYVKSTREQISRTQIQRVHWFRAVKPSGAMGPLGPFTSKDLASPAATYAALGDMDVHSSDFAAHGMAKFQKFMNAYVNAIVQNGKVNEVPLVDRFGWTSYTDDAGLRQRSFSIGNGNLTCDGVTAQDYTGAAEKLAVAMRPKGDLESWLRIPQMYEVLDQPLGMLAICYGFGSVLMPWGSGAAKSATFSLWSPGSGLGKTQLLRAVATIWGNPDDLFVQRDSSDVRIQRHLAVMHNLPAFLDEMTDKTDEDLHALAYNLVGGQEKQKMSRDGRNVVETGTWNTVAFITANRSVKEAVARYGGESVAATVRIVEMECDFKSYADMPKVQKYITERIADCTQHYGLAGPEFVYQILRHVSRLKALSSRVDHWVTTHGFTNEERFLANPLALALVAGRWAVEWGLLEYDMDKLEAWALREFVPANRKSTGTLRVDPAELMVDYLMVRQRNLLVVETDRRKGPQPAPEASVDPYVIMGPTHGDVCLRLCVEDRRLYVSVTDFRDWCRRRGYSPENIMKSLEAKGFHPRKTMRNLAVGTQRYSTPNVACHLFEGDDLDRLGYDAESLRSAWRFRADTTKAMP